MPSANFFEVGRMLEINITDKVRIYSANCKDCEYKTSVAHIDIHTMGPEEKHILETGHSIIVNTLDQSVYLPYTKEEQLERSEIIKKVKESDDLNIYDNKTGQWIMASRNE